MKIRDFKGGLNCKDIPENIADDELVGLTNNSYEEGTAIISREGITEENYVLCSPSASLYGFLKHNPVYRCCDHLERIHPLTIDVENRVYPGFLYTIGKSAGSFGKGLWFQHRKLTASIRGNFSAADFNDMVYVTNGSWQFRFLKDDTQKPLVRYIIGHGPPPKPNITTMAWCDKQIYNFDNTLTLNQWAGKTKGGYRYTTENPYEGSHCLELQADSNDPCGVKIEFSDTQNLTQYASGQKSGNLDFITFALRAFKSEHVKFMWFWFSIGDTSFKERYEIEIEPGKAYTSKALKSQPILNQKIFQTSGLPVSNMQVGEDEILMTYVPSNFDDWTLVTIPKCDFKKVGTSSYDWSSVKAFAVLLQATKIKEGDGTEIGSGTQYDNAGIFVDDLRLQGPGGECDGLIGKFYFCSQYYSSSKDEYYEVSEETDAVEFGGNHFTCATIPLPFPYTKLIDTYLLWCRPENDDHWYLAYSQKRTNPMIGNTKASIKIDFNYLIKQDELTSRAGICPMPRLLADGQLKGPGSTNHKPPPKAKILCQHKGMMFYAVGARIYHSKPGHPYAVPEDNWILCPEPVVGMRSDGNNLFVYTSVAEYAYVNAGEYQSNWIYLGYLAKSKTPMGCVSERTISDGYFCSPNGICYFDGVDTRLVSEHFDPIYKQLSRYFGPSAFSGTVWENKYVLTPPFRLIYLIDLTGDRKKITHWSMGYKTTKKDTQVQSIRDVKRHPANGRLYFSTSNGLMFYNKLRVTDYYGVDWILHEEASGILPFKLSATSKTFEYAPENQEAPLERFMVDAEIGYYYEGEMIIRESHILRGNFYVDGNIHGRLNATCALPKEFEGLMDLGAVGSKVKFALSATINSKFIRTKIKGVEVS